jgi:hypothetical protein
MTSETLSLNSLFLTILMVRKKIRHFVSNKAQYTFHFVAYLIFKIENLMKTY